MTKLIDGFLPISIEEVATLEEQRGHYEAWRASLPQVDPLPVAPLSLARKALKDSNAAIRAGGEAAIPSRGHLVSTDLAVPPDGVPTISADDALQTPSIPDHRR